VKNFLAISTQYASPGGAYGAMYVTSKPQLEQSPTASRLVGDGDQLLFRRRAGGSAKLHPLSTRQNARFHRFKSPSREERMVVVTTDSLNLLQPQFNVFPAPTTLFNIMPFIARNRPLRDHGKFRACVPHSSADLPETGVRPQRINRSATTKS
jgi:hypothetical protein